MPGDSQISIPPLNEDLFDIRGKNGGKYGNYLTPEQFYRIIADHTGDMERWVSPEGELLYISPSCEKITGYSVEEYRKDPELMVKIIHPDDKDNIQQKRIESLAGELSGNHILRILTKNGGVRWLSVVATKVTGRDGKYLGIRTSSRDITDLKKLEFKLKQNNTLYSRVVEDQVDLILRHNADGLCTFVNSSFASFFGIRKEEIPGSNWHDWSSPEETKRTEKLNAMLTIDNPVQGAVFDYPKGDGEKVYIEWIVTGLFDDSGNLAEQQVIGRDVTENERAREALQMSEVRYRTVVENQSELIVRHTVDSTILYVNHAFELFTGAAKENLIGLRWFDLADHDFVSVIRSKMKEVTIESPTVEITSAFTRADGQTRWISWISTAMFDSKGEVNEFHVVGRDITEQILVEKKLEKALEEVQELKKKLEYENKYLREKVIPVKTSEELFSNSAGMQEILDIAKEVSVTDSPVLLTGETGTGKEVLGQYIHNLSKRRRKMMITINCGALPPSLIESELFGREKGAYTGALSRQIGRFELAHQSTIFLDEIGELPLELQVKLLRIIQSGEFQMLGSPETKKVDVRIIAATNRDIEKEVEKGSFRKDLFYRLNVFPIHLPPLRERIEDIPMLAWGFIDEITARMGKTIEKISNSSMNRMLNYHWPGNIRELRNILEYSTILCKSHILEVKLPDFDVPVPETSDRIDTSQRLHIEKILNQTGWRVRGPGGAAQILGMKESTLRARMKKLGIERKK